MQGIQDFIAAHQFAISGGSVGIPWVDVNTDATGIDWHPLPLTMEEARALLGY